MTQLPSLHHPPLGLGEWSESKGVQIGESFFHTCWLSELISFDYSIASSSNLTIHI